MTKRFQSIAPDVILGEGATVHELVNNDRVPRACNPDGTPKGADDWKLEPTWIEEGASIGSGATILCGVRIGKGALVGAGAVVTKDVPAGVTAVGNPAHPR